MTMHPVNRLRRSVAGVVLGVLALVLVIAVLAGATAAVHAADTIDTLIKDLNDARGQITDLQATNNQLAEQNRQILRQNKILVRELRKHGIAIPQVVTQSPPPAESQGYGVGTLPKGLPTAQPPTTSNPRPSRPPRPRGTPGTPTQSPSTTGTPDPLTIMCTLVRPLCLPRG